MLTLLGLIVVAYIVGSIPTGYWLVKSVKGIDVRTVGSGSTGATNVMRAAGKPAGALVLALDALKGYLPTYFAIQLESGPYLSGVPGNELHLIPPVVAFFCLVGHSKSIFLGFQGGKSAATGLGTLLALHAAVGCLTFATWIFLVWATRYVSVASIVTVWLCGAFMYAFGNPGSYVGYCLLSAVYVTARHRANIKRLIQGIEPRVGEKREQSEAAGEPLTPESTHVPGAGEGTQAES